MTFTDRQQELINEWRQLPRTDERSYWTLHRFLGLTWDEFHAVATTALIIENPEGGPDARNR